MSDKSSYWPALWVWQTFTQHMSVYFYVTIRPETYYDCFAAMNCGGHVSKMVKKQKEIEVLQMVNVISDKKLVYESYIYVTK